MTQVLSLNIYRVENISFSGTPYTIRFASSRDGQENTLIVSNNATNQQAKYQFSPEVALDFKHYQNKKLETEMLNIIQDDIKNGRI